MEYDRLRNLAPNVEAVELDNWIIASFTTAPFRLWLSEWKKHLFCAPAESYCHRIDYSSAGTANEVSHHPLQLLLPFLDAQNTNFNSFSFQEFPDVSISGKQIKYAPPSKTLYIGRDAPSLKSAGLS